MASFNEITNLFEASVGDDFNKCNILILDCLKLIDQSLMPDIGIEALSVARRYWKEKDVDEKSLEDIRIRCWKYLKERGESTDFENPRVCSLRAVICSLYSNPCSDFVSDHIEIFIEMMCICLTLEDRLKLLEVINASMKQ